MDEMRVNQLGEFGSYLSVFDGRAPIVGTKDPLLHGVMTPMRQTNNILKAVSR